MRNGAEDCRFGAQSQEVNRKSGRKRPQAKQCSYCSCDSWQNFAAFWCEFNLQSMNKRKGSG